MRIERNRFIAKISYRVGKKTISGFATYPWNKWRTAQSFQLFIETLTQFLFSSFPASQNTTANLSQPMSPSSTESASFSLNVSSQSDNIPVNVSLTPSPALSFATSASAIAEVSSQGGFFSPSFSPFLSQSASSSMSESLTFFEWFGRFPFNKRTSKRVGKCRSSF